MSIPPTTEGAALLEAVARLAHVGPYIDDDARLTRAEFDVYWRGYYRAIVQALRVMELALRRHELRRQGARRRAREARREAVRVSNAERRDRQQADLADRYAGRSHVAQRLDPGDANRERAAHVRQRGMGCARYGRRDVRRPGSGQAPISGRPFSYGRGLCSAK